MSTVEKFQAAVDVIRGLPKQGSFQPSSDMQLKFYSFYKQATEGPCRNPKPSFWDIIGKAKWDAWKSLGSMPKEEAMEKYVDELKEVIKILKKQHENGNTALTKDQIVETMSYTDSVSKFLDLLGPFYESVPLEQTTETSVNGDNSTDRGVVKPGAVPYAKGEKSEPDNGHVNGFGEAGDLDSDGDEFSDTYDNIKEPLEDGNGDLSSFPLGEGGCGGDGVSQTVTGNRTNVVECASNCSGMLNNGLAALTLEDCSFSHLNSLNHSKDHYFEDSPARHSHPAMSPNRNQSLLNHDFSYSQPVLLQENENHIWAISREDMTNAVGHFKSAIVHGVVQARGGSDQGLGSVNPRANSAGSGGTGGSTSARTQRNRLTREGGPVHGGERMTVPGGSGESPGGSQNRISSYSDVSDQLALAVIKLQHSMDDVNTRLASLELALSGRNLAQKSPQRKGVIRHLFGISPQLLLLILTWPFLAQWIIYLIRKRSQR